MLQQTQVATVIPYYQQLHGVFPDVHALAARRWIRCCICGQGSAITPGRNLHKAAQQVCAEHQGHFPDSVEELESLPGIGRSTAGAIAALAMHIRAPILDGNVKRVLTRYFAIAGYPESSAVKSRLWKLAESLLPESGIAAYTQAMMDLGATGTRTGPTAAGVHWRIAARRWPPMRLRRIRARTNRTNR